MSDLNIANQVISTANTALNFFDIVYSKVENIKNKNLSTQNYLRAYYFEVVNNLELLSIVNTKKFASLSVNSTLFQKFINKLDTQIGATILFTENIDKTSDLYKLLKTKGRIENKNKMLIVNNKGLEQSYSGKILYENILQAISFTVVKIEVLKRLSALDSEEVEYINKILLEKRIVNIKQRFIMIKNIMDGIEGIKEISR